LTEKIAKKQRQKKIKTKKTNKIQIKKTKFQKSWLKKTNSASKKQKK